MDMKTIRGATLCLPILFLGSTAQIAFAEDATVVAPEHYKVEFENEKVRVIRITYGPGEESAMHEHAEGIVVNLTDQNTQFTLPDGTTPAVEPGPAGSISWSPAGMHAAKNLSDGPAGALLIEIKD